MRIFGFMPVSMLKVYLYYKNKDIGLNNFLYLDSDKMWTFLELVKVLDKTILDKNRNN